MVLALYPDFLKRSVFEDALAKRKTDGPLFYENIFNEVAVGHAKAIKRQHPDMTYDKAIFISRCGLMREEGKFFIKSLFTRSADYWRVIGSELKTIPAQLTYYCPLYCLDSVSLERSIARDLRACDIPKRYIGYSRGEFPPYQRGSFRVMPFMSRILAWFGAILLVLGFGYALWGLLASFKRYTEENKEKLLRSAILSHTVGFCVVQGLLWTDARYIMHAAFLSNFLGWWAVADFCGFCKKRKRIAQNKVA
jgi:hypothetical protein